MLLRHLFEIESPGRQKGLSLPKTGFADSYVMIYRAVPTKVSTFKPMDYITLGRKWAIGHAEHMAAVEGEDYHVLRAFVRSDRVFEAYNPGEYFYDGPETPGRPIRGDDLRPYRARAE